MVHPCMQIGLWKLNGNTLVFSDFNLCEPVIISAVIYSVVVTLNFGVIPSKEEHYV